MPKSKHQVPGRVRSTYAFIKAHRDRHSVEAMCRSNAPSQSSRRPESRTIRSGSQAAPATSPLNPGNSTARFAEGECKVRRMVEAAGVERERSAIEN